MSTYSSPPVAHNLDSLNHSCSHLLAAAVTELWPHVLPAFGPAIENGFYYDFDFGDTKISESDFPAVESKMHDLAKTWSKFESKEVNKNQALKDFANNPYKIELINEITNQPITYYQSGNFFDLCKGGHADLSSQPLEHFKLLSVAGAYWRGKENNKMLTRIYGTCWPSKQELDDYLQKLEIAKQNDHRKLGRDLDLFTFSPLVGSGLPLYTPRGAFIRLQLAKFIEDLQSAAGYTQVWTPQIAKADLFKASGHYEKYKSDMFRVFSNYSEEEFFLKPMNCPQHTQIYLSRPRSYRDLPLRFSDFAMLYRDEQPGELHGLARVRAFSQDDSHIFCREDQVDAEIDLALSMIKQAMSIFGFRYKYRLSTRDPNHPEKYLGDSKIWDKVEKWAVQIMERNHIEYFNGPGEAAFYAPKMDLIATDALGRSWQLSTVQIDYVMPQRFNLTYTDSDGLEKHPIMIHRAILGSPERFLMILLEHTGGHLPLWLSPVQVVVLPITDRHLEYANLINQQLRDHHIRVELNEKKEPLNARIRDAQLQKVPFMVILGDKEIANNTISLRNRTGSAQSEVTIHEFVNQLKSQIDNKTLL